MAKRGVGKYSDVTKGENGEKDKLAKITAAVKTGITELRLYRAANQAVVNGDEIDADIAFAESALALKVPENKMEAYARLLSDVKSVLGF